MSEQSTKVVNTLFVGNLPYSVLDNEFQQLVSEHADVATAVVVRDERDRSRGFGFVRFHSEEEASKAHQALDGKDFGGRKLRSSFARTDSRYLSLVHD